MAGTPIENNTRPLFENNNNDSSKISEENFFSPNEDKESSEDDDDAFEPDENIIPCRLPLGVHALEENTRNMEKSNFLKSNQRLLLFI